MQAVQRTYKNGVDVPFPRIASEPLYFGKRTPTHFEGWRALVDQEDGSVVSVVSAGYQMIRHEAIVEAAESALKAQGLHFERSITLIREGAKMVATYTIPEINVTVGDGDVLNPTIIIKNSYDLSWVASILGGIYRLICSNGAYLGTMFEKFRHRHVGTLNAEQMSARISGVTHSFNTFSDFYKTQASIPLTNDFTENVLDALPLNKGEQSALGTLHERTSGLTIDLIPNRRKDEDKEVVWAIKGGDHEKYSRVNLFNLLTEFNTHRVGSAVRRDMFSNKIARAMMH